MKNSSVGIFDSGIGGLFVAKKIADCFPNQDIVYFGDTARMPYGNKNSELISMYVHRNINFLKGKNTSIVVAACGTASTILINKKYDYKIPVVGIVLPLCLKAVKSTKKKRIGIIGTKIAINSNQYKNTIEGMSSKIKVFQQRCPMLASMIENHEKDESLIEILKKYLYPLIKKDIDVLVLGCTHYSFIKDIIGKLFVNVNIIDPAQEMIYFLEKENLVYKNNNNKGILKVFVSKFSRDFTEKLKFFFGNEILKNMQLIE